MQDPTHTQREGAISMKLLTWGRHRAQAMFVGFKSFSATNLNFQEAQQLPIVKNQAQHS